MASWSLLPCASSTTACREIAGAEPSSGMLAESRSFPSISSGRSTPSQLALLPAMVGVERIVGDSSNQRWIRLGLLLLALLPTCYYTLPVRMLSFAYGEGQPISLNRYITLGQLAALILLWPYLLDCRGSSKDNKASA